MRSNNIIGIGQPLNPEDRDLVCTIYDRLRIWKDGCQEFHDRARVARKVLLLEDPYQDPPNTKPEEKTLQVQTLKSTFNNCVADQMDNVMEARMMPEIPLEQGLVDDINDIVSYIYELNNYQQMHRARIQDYLCTGTAITEIMWDKDLSYGKGDVAFVRVPIEQFLWDPAESDIQNARALFKVSWHPMSWYESHYPDAYRYINSDEHGADAVGEEENQEELGADEDKAMLLEYWWRTYDSDKHRYTINVAYCAGRALLEKHEDVYAHGMYPFVLDVHTEIEGIPVGEGLVMELTPMMRYVNRYLHYMDMNIRASAKTRLLVSNSANVDIDEISDWNNTVITADVINENAIRFMNSPPLTSLALNQMMQLQTDIKQDSGQNQFTRGETAGGVTAATAISALQEAGGKQTRMRTETLKHGFKRITEQVLWLISEFYDEGRYVMITGSVENLDAKSRMIDASPSRIMPKEGRNGVIPPPPYSVRIQVQRKNPNAISDQNNLVIDAYKMSAEAGQMFPLSALFRLLTIDGKDKILPVIESVENFTQTLQALQQQNAQLQQTAQQQTEDIANLKSSLVEQAKQKLNTSAVNNQNMAPQGMPQGTLQQ